MLEIHRAERADVLADALAELLTDVPADPFAADVVAVPTRGIERWLTQALSASLGARPHERDGVCANVEFPFPGTLVAEALALAGGIAPERDPWHPARLVWPLMRVVDEALDEPWLRPLARHLAAGNDHRYPRLAHLARLFDEYAVRRPELVQAWARGEPGGIDEHAASGWQPELWRRLREAVGVPSLAERLEPACARLAREPELVPLPPRFALFGITRLPASQLQVLRALAVSRDVHLMLLHPSPAMWARGDATNRLLASWGRDVHGLQTLVAGTGSDSHHPLPDRDRRSTLLAAIQADVRADRQPPGPPLREGDADERLTLAPGDRSVQIHACHGRARQVEVLREAILHRLAADPTLEPRDLIVMCPDIESFAPLIEATFGSRAEPEDAATGVERGRAVGEPPALRVRLADRSLRRTTPLLAVTARLLELSSSRVTASEVLDLADTAPVRARFGFDDDELARIREWITDARIHWGLDAGARAGYRMPNDDAGTWAAGLRRLLLGVAMAQNGDAPLAGVLPAGAIQSSEIELAGRLAELVARLDGALRSLSGSRTAEGWAAALAHAVATLTTTPDRDAWQRRQLDAILAAIVEESGGSAIELTLTELRTLLAHRLEGRPTRANFRSGHLTFCTLVPMRSVPHRVICLLGLDDGAFPRPSPRDGDNLLLAQRRPGDRDPRTEDRQLLLDALLAAGDALIITYTGNDERTNAECPAAVPVGELLDAIDATARLADGRPARETVVVHHPLQAFDPRNFTAHDSDPGRAAAGPWSFDAAALAGARAFVAPRRAPPPFLPVPLPPVADSELVTLDELVWFVRNPVGAFLRQRLGVRLTEDGDEVEDALPIELDPLARWGVGQRLLISRLAGAGKRDAYRREIARGTLPPGKLAIPVIESVWPAAKLIADQADIFRQGSEPRSEATNLTASAALRMTGTVDGIHGQILLSVRYSRLHPEHRLTAWVRLLALTATHPEDRFEAVTIGRPPRGDGVCVVRIRQLGGSAATRRDAALAELAKLVELRAEGLRRPLPLPCRTAAAYVEAALAGEDPLERAGESWFSGWRSGQWLDREDRTPEHVLALGDEPDWNELGPLAQALWEPLLAREQWGPR